MEDKTLHFECDECGAEYSVNTEMDLVPEFCPFCGEPIEKIEWNSDYEDAIGEGEGTQTTTEVQGDVD